LLDGVYLLEPVGAGRVAKTKFFCGKIFEEEIWMTKECRPLEEIKQDNRSIIKTVENLVDYSAKASLVSKTMGRTVFNFIFYEENIIFLPLHMTRPD